MTDWIHCNKCLLKYCPDIKLFLSECGHLFCQKCAENLTDSKCIICQKPVKTIQISNDMETTIQQFFLPFDAYLKKAIEVYNFQMQHRARLFQTTIQKYNFAKKECISCFSKNRDLMKENKMLKSMLMSAGHNAVPKPFLTSTPATNVSQPDNMSVMSSIGFTPAASGLSSRPGVAQRVQVFRNHHCPGPYIPLHLSSAESSLRRPSPAQLVPNMERKLNIAPIHRPQGGAFSIEQLHRPAKRT